jgi:crotonobetainyl-CoA:carnitine CoA-transferase CaiB-like acyl-CoA transferase
MDSSVGQERALPLAGVRVLDFTHAVTGSYAAMIMGDLGAEGHQDREASQGDMIGT